MYHRIALMVLMPVLLLVAGCGSSQPTGTLTGTITFEKQPVTLGSLTVVSEDGKRPVSGRIKADGTYIVEGAPAGNVKIAYLAPTGGTGDGAKMGAPPADVGLKMKDQMKDRMPPAPEGRPDLTEEQKKLTKALEALPIRYRSWQNSGLTCTVEANKENTYNIEMKAK